MDKICAYLAKEKEQLGEVLKNFMQEQKAICMNDLPLMERVLSARSAMIDSLQDMDRKIKMERIGRSAAYHPRQQKLEGEIKILADKINRINTLNKMLLKKRMDS